MQPYYKGEEGIEEGTSVSHLVLLINQAFLPLFKRKKRKHCFCSLGMLRRGNSGVEYPSIHYIYCLD